MRQALRPIVFTLALVTITTGCFWFGPSPEERAQFMDGTLVIPLMPRSADGAVRVYTGAYQGGTAVLGEQHTAFWIKDGVPYAVSEAARSAAPDMAHAPESIQYNDEFIAAAKGES